MYITLSLVTSLHYIKAAMCDVSIGTKIFSCRIHMHELNNLFLQRDLIYPLFTLITLLFSLELLLSTLIGIVFRKITPNMIGRSLSCIQDKYICDGRKQAIEKCIRIISCFDTIV